jgi:hypothetical protein
MPDDCVALIDALIPAAMPVLADLIVEHAKELCVEIAEVC